MKVKNKEKDKEKKTFLKIAYTPAEVAQMLGVTSSKVRNWIKSGYLHGVRMGKLWMVPQAEIKRLSGLNPPDLDAFIAWSHEGVILENTGIVQEYEFPEESIFELSLEDNSDRDLKFKSDRLDYILESMCRQSGFSGSVLTDDKGLIIAYFNLPYEREEVSAFAAVIIDELKKGDRILGLKDIHKIVLSVNKVDKIVVNIFEEEGIKYLLLVFGRQDVDERWIDPAISKLKELLTDKKDKHE